MLHMQHAGYVNNTLGSICGSEKNRWRMKKLYNHDVSEQREHWTVACKY